MRPVRQHDVHHHIPEMMLTHARQAQRTSRCERKSKLSTPHTSKEMIGAYQMTHHTTADTTRLTGRTPTRPMGRKRLFFIRLLVGLRWSLGRPTNSNSAHEFGTSRCKRGVKLPRTAIIGGYKCNRTACMGEPNLLFRFAFFISGLSWIRGG